MRILYACMKYDYGDATRGFGVEHTNFYQTLVKMGHEVIYFDFMTLHQEMGFEKMNAHLLDLVHTEKPDMMFSCLFTDQFDPAVLRKISEETDTVTVNWFADDHWRFDSYSKYWAPCFNWVTTTANSALPKYKQMGYKNVIKTQWAANQFDYVNMNLPMQYNVTFVGQPHGDRRTVISALHQAGIDVQTWGYGWENGRVSQEEMIRIFNESKINLNLSNAYQIKQRFRFIPGWTDRKKHQQIKARNFEIPACGGFLLTGAADNINEYYDDGKEIVVFKNTEDMITKSKYYLAHNEERQRIAQAGYERTLREHTYVHRFHSIFKAIGLESS